VTFGGSSGQPGEGPEETRGRFLPRSVMIGFVNALAILIFLSQVPHLVDVPWAMYSLLAAGLVVIVGLPRLTQRHRHRWWRSPV
jgi:MFS superfamily sulfate permease-like transporter